MFSKLTYSIFKLKNIIQKTRQQKKNKTNSAAVSVKQTWPGSLSQPRTLLWAVPRRNSVSPHRRKHAPTHRWNASWLPANIAAAETDAISICTLLSWGRALSSMSRRLDAPQHWYNWWVKFCRRKIVLNLNCSQWCPWIIKGSWWLCCWGFLGVLSFFWHLEPSAT